LSSKIRGLATIALDWAKIAKPKMIFLENVKEFRKWGPLTKKNKPNKRLSGTYFTNFIATLMDMGYEVDFKTLAAHHYGVPTTRERLFLIARRDGRAPRWPSPTHGPEGSVCRLGLPLKPFVPASTCIDWTLPTQSIFGRKKDLAEATMKRIFKGLKKFVLECDSPFIAPVSFECDGNEKKVAAFIAKHYGGPNGNQSPGSSLNNPLGTKTAVDHNALVVATMVRHFGTGGGASLRKPMPTVMPGGCGKTSLVEAFLIKYYGTGGGADLNAPMPTITTKDRLGLVTVYGTRYKIVDIRMRMLSPKELFKANGFPSDYIINPIMPNGKPMTKTDQVKMVGNSVCPPLAKAIVRKNYDDFD
jgi:DNA (cytosine-5)-methyltransferase 1